MSNNTSTASINKPISSGDTNNDAPKGFPAKPQLTPAARICILALSITCVTTSLSQLPIWPDPGPSRVLLATSIFHTVTGFITYVLLTMREQPTASFNPTFTTALATLLVFHFTFAVAMLLDDYGYTEMAIVVLVGAGMELGGVGVLMIQEWSIWGPDGDVDVEAALGEGEKGLE